MWKKINFVYKCMSCKKLIYESQFKYGGYTSCKCGSRRFTGIEVTRLGEWLYTKTNNYYKWYYQRRKTDDRAISR